MRHQQVFQRGRHLLIIAAAVAGLSASASRADDPFAPPGTVLIRMPIPERPVFNELRRMGLQPEDATREEICYRVSPEQLSRIQAMGLVYRLESEIEPDARDRELPITSYAQMVAELTQIAADYPDITELVSCGQSVQGREIWALKVSANPQLEEAEPEVRIVGAHHGNEQMSTEVNLNLAYHLTGNYANDLTITRLVDTMEIWIVPMVNPDGYEADSRYNAHGVDLNRNYGYMGSTSAFSEPETRAIRDLSTDNWFALSLSFHCSGDIVNSVWNYTPIYPEDDDVVATLSDLYASFNGYWAVHGWYWYETHGDCNDWSYGARADMDWTIEVSSYNETAVWNDNRDAIIAFIDAAGWGVHGVVTDATTGAPLRARVWVEGNGWPAFTDPVVGDYHKPLLEGSYTLHFSANGYQDLVVPGVSVPAEGGVTVDAQLTRGGGHYADRVEVARVEDPNDTYSNLTLTMSVLGAPDEIGCSIGRGGEIVMDLGPGSELHDQAGDDVTIYESTEDATGEGFRLYAGDSHLGPWTLVGTGAGTTSFDVTGTGIETARYLRVVDDGDGSANDPNAGFDLDAVDVAGTLVAISAADISPPAWVSLRAVRPNPVRSRRGAEVLFETASDGDFRLDVYDITGRKVTTLTRGTWGAGMHLVRWDGTDRSGRRVTPGVYVVRVASAGEASSRTIVVVD